MTAAVLELTRNRVNQSEVVRQHFELTERAIREQLLPLLDVLEICVSPKMVELSEVITRYQRENEVVDAALAQTLAQVAAFSLEVLALCRAYAVVMDASKEDIAITK